jgi:hypothetical protein
MPFFGAARVSSAVSGSYRGICPVCNDEYARLQAVTVPNWQGEVVEYRYIHEVARRNGTTVLTDYCTVQPETEDAGQQDE